MESRTERATRRKTTSPTSQVGAMAAGVERHPWSLTQIAELLD